MDDDRVAALERAVHQDPSDREALEAYLSLWRRLGRRDAENPVVIDGLKRLADAGPRALDHYIRLEAAWREAGRLFGEHERAEDLFVFTNGEGTWPIYSIQRLGSLAVAAIDRRLRAGGESERCALLYVLEDMEPRGLPLAPAIFVAIRSFLAAHRPEFFSDARWHEARNDLLDYAARALFQVDPEGLETREDLGQEPRFAAVLARWIVRAAPASQERADWALSILGGCEAPGPEACALLIRGLNGGPRADARRSVRGLGILAASSAAARRALGGALRHESRSVRAAALEELRRGDRGDFEALEGVVQALEAGALTPAAAGPFPWERHRGARRAAWSLARAARADGRERVQAYRSMAQLAAAAAEEKARIDAERAAGRLSASYARASRAKIDRQLAGLLPALESGRRAAEPALRARAFEASIAGAADRARLLGEALADPAEQVRLAALKAALRRPLEARLRPGLERATRDPARSVRRRAWAALRRADGEP